MRRRRQGLQVNTFPFLAVLLCAMGSLILLLLVIDRRAKAVARAKAQQALEQVREEQEIVTQVRAVLSQTAEAEARLRGEEQRQRARSARLDAERALFRRGEEEA